MLFSFRTILRSWTAVFSRVKTIPHDDPELTPEKCCERQPCMRVNIAFRTIIISQPFSTFWVYFLGVGTIFTGLYFFQIHQNQISRYWWGIALVLWGIGAILAGTSYQAFGYHIKCAGRKVCAWTSWWELIYLLFQQVSMNSLLAAVAYSCTTGTLQTALLGYALLSSIVYSLIVFIGGIVPTKQLITFEFMVCFSAPILFFCMVLNASRLILYKEVMDLALLGTWIFLLLIMAVYWIYYKSGITKKMWAKGFWFSENDVLHVLLIFWMIYIAGVLAGQIKDYTPSL